MSEQSYTSLFTNPIDYSKVRDMFEKLSVVKLEDPSFFLLMNSEDFESYKEFLLEKLTLCEDGKYRYNEIIFYPHWAAEKGFIKPMPISLLKPLKVNYGGFESGGII